MVACIARWSEVISEGPQEVTFIRKKARSYEHNQLGVTFFVIRNGNAGKCIQSEARDWKADLVVLGSHEHGALTRLLFGSVSRFVCEHAQCSVEVVH